MKSKNYGIDHRFEMDMSNERIIFKTLSGREIARIDVETVEHDVQKTKGGPWTVEPTNNFYFKFTVLADDMSGSRFAAAFVEEE